VAGDTAAAVSFLLSYAPDGPWTVVADREAEGRRGRWHVGQFADAAALAEFIEAHNGRNNLYFPVNPVRLGLATSPEEADVTGLVCVPLDVDLPVGHSQEEVEEVLSRARRTEPPPTYLVFSGGGIQGGWLFGSVLALSYGPDVQRQVVEVADALGGDHVQNPNRLMRLPGTVNVLNEKKRALGREPAEAYLIEADWSRRYAVPTATRVPPPRGKAFEDLDAEWRVRIETGSVAWLTGKDRTRSAAVWRVAIHLVEAGWTDAEIESLLLNRTYGLSGHVYAQSHPARYAARQARNARAAIQNDYVRSRSTRAIVANRMDNVAKALAQVNVSLAYDEFSHRISWVNGEDRGERELDDYSLSYLRMTILNRVNFQPPKDVLYDTCLVVARSFTVNPIREYLEATAWDGRERLATWLIDYGGAEDNPYVRAVSQIILVAAVTRVYAPGVKFDEMLVLESSQGLDKSTAIRALCPVEAWFTDSLALTASSKEAIENLSGKWIVEVQELAGLRQRDVENLKAFMSRATDRARLAYDRTVTEKPRTCVFFGTTNSTRYLRDEENRRFWPVLIRRIMDSGALREVRDQLWAEAVHLYRSGFSIRLARELWQLAKFEQDKRRVEDGWLFDLEGPLGARTGRITTVDVFKVLGLDKNAGLRNQEANYRVGSAMRELGWERVQAKVHGQVRWVYARGTPEERRQLLYAVRDPVTGEVAIEEALPFTPTPPAPAASPPLEDDLPF